MNALRRCLILHLQQREALDFDASALLHGTGGLSCRLHWEALAPHLPRPVALDEEEVAALGCFGPTLWVERREAERRVAPAVLERLVALGLLLVDDTSLSAAARADAALRAAAWHPLAAIAHHQSRWSHHDAEAVRRAAEFDVVRRLVERHGPPPPECHERRDRHARQPLPQHVPDDFDQLLRRRVTCRNFDPGSTLSLGEIAALLGRVFGIQGEETLAPGAVALKKNHPSGGALHPFEAYLVLRRVEGLAPGLYHYQARAHALDLLRPLSANEAEALVLAALAGQQFFADAPAHVLLTARFARSQWKYRENTKLYRVIQIEAGHIAQNIYLSATHQGLGAYVTAAINEVELEQAFGLDPMLEGPLAVCGFGRRATERTTLEFDPAHAVWPAAMS